MNFFKILLNKILQSPLKFTAKEVMLPAKHKLREVGFLQNAVFNSANFFSIVTDVNGVIQIFSIGAEKSLGYSATEVIGKMTAANLSSTRNLTLLANVLSLEFETVIAPGFEAMVFKATRGIKNIYKLTYIRKDGSHFPVMISVTALRDNNQAITGYLLISTDDIRQKLAKRVLRKATVWQNVIFNSANFPIIATDVDGIIQVFNIGAEQTLGYSATEVIDKMTLVDLSDASGLIRRADSLSMEFEEQIAPNFKAMIFKAALGIEDIYELTYICKDGNPFSVQVSVTALYADDSIIGYLLIGTNNAARKAAKRKARKTDTLQNAIFNSINFSSIATDVNGVIQIFNVGAEHMLGYSAAEVVNTMTPADLSDTEELILRAKALSLEFGAVINSDFESLIFKASRGIEDIYELTYIRKDGSRFPAMVSVTALRDKDGIIGYLLIGTDNTARKKAEDGICIAAVAFEAAQGMFITDSIGSLIHVNPAFLEITGYTTAELIGNNPRILKSDKHSSEFYTSMWQSINTDGKWLGEIWNRKKNDELYLAQLSIVKVVNTQGITTNYVATLVDITQRKQYETDLILAKERAEHFLKLKSQFIASMSHEIRTPMAAIIGFSELALYINTKDKDDKVTNYLKNIYTASTSLLGILNDILDFSKLEAGCVVINSMCFDFNALLDTINSIFSGAALQNGIDLTIEIDSLVPKLNMPCELIGDKLRLQQVLTNLIGNAIKFTKQGKVKLKISLISINLTHARILFSVSDTGIGIDDDDKSKLFKSFSQVDGSITRTYGGTGLGLVISSELLELMGSQISVTSVVGVGSSFSFELLMGVPSTYIEDPINKSILLSMFNLSGSRVLLVEDSLMIQMLVEDRLAWSGIIVDIANNGKEALAMLEQNNYSAVLMDIHMPIMNGIKATKRIRSQARFKDLPVIALTAGATVEERDLCLACGMNDFISKPTDFKQLLLVLERWIKLSLS